MPMVGKLFNFYVTGWYLFSGFYNHFYGKKNYNEIGEWVVLNKKSKN